MFYLWGNIEEVTKRRGRERATGDRRSVYTHTDQYAGETGATAQLSPSSAYGT
jgi:hypothetical protein